MHEHKLNKEKQQSSRKSMQGFDLILQIPKRKKHQNESRKGEVHSFPKTVLVLCRQNPS